MRRHIGVFALSAVATGAITLSCSSNPIGHIGGPLSIPDAGAPDATETAEGGGSTGDGGAMDGANVTDAFAAGDTAADGTGGDSSAADAGVDGATQDGAGDSGAGADASDAAPALGDLLFAHFSPDAPPLDLCMVPAGMTWAGQVPQGFIGIADDGGTGPISFPQIGVGGEPVGSYTVRLV
ncbi:MAG: hypothetical protein ACREJ3_15295, partial [Polyangiaceae bacterium]